MQDFSVPINEVASDILTSSSVELEASSFRQRVALLVEYCGTDFHGSQFQSDRKTVQSTLQSALAKLKLPASPVSFSGRTDSGVHAQGQVAHFDLHHPGSLLKIPNLALALNTFLPDTVAVKAVAPEVSLSFHSRRDALCKWYRYRIYNAPHRSAWGMGATHVWTPLDVPKMQETVSFLLGQHNFASFKGSDTDIKDNICNILYAKVTQNGQFIDLDIVANRFLYKMVRTLVGQLIVIGRSKYPPETILEVLAAQDRRCAAPTAPPQGLSLMAVQYPSCFNFFAQDVLVQELESMLNPMKMELFSHEDLFRKAS